MIILKSNEFWGRRSGTIIKNKSSSQPSFRAVQWGSGKSSGKKTFSRTERSPNLPRAWFGGEYKTKDQKKYAKNKKGKK